MKKTKLSLILTGLLMSLNLNASNNIKENIILETSPEALISKDILRNTIIENEKFKHEINKIKLSNEEIKLKNEEINLNKDKMKHSYIKNKLIDAKTKESLAESEMKYNKINMREKFLKRYPMTSLDFKPKEIDLFLNKHKGEMESKKDINEIIKENKKTFKNIEISNNILLNIKISKIKRLLNNYFKLINNLSTKKINKIESDKILKLFENGQYLKISINNLENNIKLNNLNENNKEIQIIKSLSLENNEIIRKLESKIFELKLELNQKEFKFKNNNINKKNKISQNYEKYLDFVEKDKLNKIFSNISNYETNLKKLKNPKNLKSVLNDLNFPDNLNIFHAKLEILKKIKFLTTQKYKIIVKAENKMKKANKLAKKREEILRKQKIIQEEKRRKAEEKAKQEKAKQEQIEKAKQEKAEQEQIEAQKTEAFKNNYMITGYMGNVLYLKNINEGKNIKLYINDKILGWTFIKWNDRTLRATFKNNKTNKLINFGLNINTIDTQEQPKIINANDNKNISKDEVSSSKVTNSVVSENL